MALKDDGETLSTAEAVNAKWFSVAYELTTELSDPNNIKDVEQFANASSPMKLIETGR